MWHLFSPSDVTASYHRQRHNLIMTACQQWQPGGSSASAGFTHWGQFLEHELVPRPQQRLRRTGRLDLDSVYGDGVAFGGNGTLAVDTRDGKTVDLPRDGRTALIPDPRNDENLLVAQFHLLLLRLHNSLVELILAREPSLIPPDAYDRARQHTIRIFHHITRQQYLRKILWPSVYNFLFEDDQTLFTGRFAPPITAEQLPVDIALGALRFGHSMIRDQKARGDDLPDISLEDIFDGHGTSDVLDSVSLPPEYTDTWPHIFSFGTEARTNSSRSADPMVVGAMAQIRDIVDANLCQGYDAQLPSGQEAVEEMLAVRPELAALGLTPRPTPMSRDRSNLPVLKRAGIADRTPLWLFTLLDSTRAGAGGRILGPFGSLLVGSAIKWAMENAERFEPTLPTIKDSVALTGSSLDSIQDIVRLLRNDASDYAEQRYY